jgi:hypothetical protein
MSFRSLIQQQQHQLWQQPIAHGKEGRTAAEHEAMLRTMTAMQNRKACD